MKTTRFTSMFFLLAITCFFPVANTSAQVQGTLFTGENARSDWSDAVSLRPIEQPIEEDNFESLMTTAGGVLSSDGSLQDLQNPQSLPWGSISGSSSLAFETSFSGIYLDIDNDDGSRTVIAPYLFSLVNNVDEIVPTVDFTFDNPDRGPLTGFLLGFLPFGGGDIEYQITIYDDLGAPIDTFDISIGEEGSNTDMSSKDFGSVSVGWINNDDRNVSRVEVASKPLSSDVAVAVVGRGQFAFLDAEPPVETCFDQLTDVRDEVANLLTTSEGRDAAYLRGALSCIQWSQNDWFWEQPSGDRLSIYGSSVFIGAAYTVSYLKRVKDPQADVIIDDLLDVLECIVDNEIEYAIANGGRESFIERAVDFAELGEIIDGDFDNQVVATLAYKLAWVHAYYATY